MYLFFRGGQLLKGFRGLGIWVQGERMCLACVKPAHNKPAHNKKENK